MTTAVVLLVYLVLIVLVLAFFAGAHRLNGHDLTDEEAAEIAKSLTQGDRYILIPEHVAQAERGSAELMQREAPAADGRGT